MLVSDLLHSCANESVAEAAVASLGGDLLIELRAEATKRNTSVGTLASTAVRHFAHRASERDWRELTEATRGHDTPVLSGLRIILTRHTAPRREDERRLAAWAVSRGLPIAAQASLLAEAIAC